MCGARLNGFPMVEILLEKTKTVIAWSHLPAWRSINVFVSNYQIYLSQIAIYICLKLQNVFETRLKSFLKRRKQWKLEVSCLPGAPLMYLSQIAMCICLKLPNVFVYNCKMNLSQNAKYICLKLQNIFVSNCKTYLLQISKLICLTLQNVFVSSCKMYLFQIAKYICLKL